MCLQRVLFIPTLVLAPLTSLAQGGTVDHWETIIGEGSLCSYLVPVSEVDSAWKTFAYNDTTWEYGPGGVGYGDEDDLTTIDPALSVYCRYRFQVIDPAGISSLILDMDFDDGFIAYLNGMEIARFNLGDSGVPVAWSDTTLDLHEAGLYRGMEPYRVILDDPASETLVPGENILAVEVHNRSITSSDLSSNVFLHAGMTGPGQTYSATPSWFHPPIQQDSTLLPLVIIDTEGQEIPNEPRIIAHMGLIDNGPGAYNAPGDPFNGYDGRISIELRGESTQWLYPKKSYSLETQMENGENNNISLLGLPEENDFVLYGPYGDKSLIRNVVVYRMYEKFGHYSPRTRFVEVVVNGDYLGLYVLTEKIKRDKNRVDMARITPEDTAGTGISGGYLLRIDKLTDLSPEAYWESTVDPPVEGYGRFQYQYFDPKYDELLEVQKAYIRDHMDRFEKAFVHNAYSDTLEGYRAYLDIPSFIDLMILNEFSKDVDGYRLSHYFYKQKDTKGGKLVSGPPWDYNLAFGNSDYTTDVHETFNWTYTLTNTVYWWAWAMNDPWFRQRLYCRWDELFASVLSPGSVSQMIDSSLSLIGEAIPRNFQRWPVLGEYVWPNWFIGRDFDEEENYLRNWIGERLQWVDNKWGGLCFSTSAHGETSFRPQGKLRVYPNPSDLSATWFVLDHTPAKAVKVRILNLNGQVVFYGPAGYSTGEMAYLLPDLRSLADGIYMLEVTCGYELRETTLMIKQ